MAKKNYFQNTHRYMENLKKTRKKIYMLRMTLKRIFKFRILKFKNIAGP